MAKLPQQNIKRVARMAAWLLKRKAVAVLL